MNISRQLGVVGLVILILLTISVNSALAGSYTFELIADQSGPLSGFLGSPSVNNNGSVVFIASLNSGQQGIYINSGGVITTIADTTSPLIAGIGGSPSINDNATVAFFGNLPTGGGGIFKGNGTSFDSVTLNNGTEAYGDSPSINNSGAVAYTRQFSTGLDIQVNNGTSITTIADTSGQFSTFTGAPSINDSRVVAFKANFDTGGDGVFTGDGASITTINNDPTNGFASPEINGTGTVAYKDMINSRIISHDGVTQTIVADISGPYSYFDNPSINDSGTVNFRADLDAGGEGIFSGSDATLDKIVETGDVLFGLELSGIEYFRGLNNSGQLSFKASFIDGSQAIVLASPVPIPPNTPPVADAGPDQSLLQLGTNVQLDGSQSIDPDGDPITFLWQLAVPTSSNAALDDPTSATPSFIADLYGDYVGSLTVTDNKGASSQDQVTVSFQNIKPVADAGANQAVLVGDTVMLDGSGSSDVNGDILGFQWNIDTAPTGSVAPINNPTSSMASIAPDLPGTYVMSLVVNDGLLGSDPDTADIVAISLPNAAATKVMDIISVINSLDQSVFKNTNVRDLLTSKLNKALADIEAGRYKQAIGTLEHNVLSKTDGCAISGAVENNDWIVTCDAQAQVYPLVVEAIDILNRL